MAENEKTSKRLATLASKVLKGVKTPTAKEVRSLAGALLTQTSDKKS